MGSGRRPLASACIFGHPGGISLTSLQAVIHGTREEIPPSGYDVDAGHEWVLRTLPYVFPKCLLEAHLQIVLVLQQFHLFFGQDAHEIADAPGFEIHLLALQFQQFVNGVFMHRFIQQHRACN
jgi:hypothetical protein